MSPFLVGFESGGVGRNCSDLSALQTAATLSLLEGVWMCIVHRIPARALHGRETGTAVEVKNNDHWEERAQRTRVVCDTTRLSFKNMVDWRLF